MPKIPMPMHIQTTIGITTIQTIKIIPAHADYAPVRFHG